MKKIRYGNKDWLIDDDANIPTPLIDWILEARQGNGIVYLGLGSSKIDAENDPEVQVRSRPRMTLAVAKQLHTQLGKVIAEAEQSAT